MYDEYIDLICCLNAANTSEDPERISEAYDELLQMQQPLLSPEDQRFWDETIRNAEELLNHELAASCPW